MSPVTVDAVGLVNDAPVPVNNAKLEVAPKVGATCPKVKFVNKDKITTVRIISNLLFILIRFN
jgi:hypothetical protein